MAHRRKRRHGRHFRGLFGKLGLKIPNLKSSGKEAAITALVGLGGALAGNAVLKVWNDRQSAAGKSVIAPDSPTAYLAAPILGALFGLLAGKALKGKGGSSRYFVIGAAGGLIVTGFKYVTNAEWGKKYFSDLVRVRMAGPGGMRNVLIPQNALGNVVIAGGGGRRAMRGLQSASNLGGLQYAAMSPAAKAAMGQSLTRVRT